MIDRHQVRLDVLVFLPGIPIAAILAIGRGGDLGHVLAWHVAAYLGFAIVMFSIRRGVGPSLAAIVVTGIVLCAVAIATPPAQSGDIGSYSIYGRMVAIHHASPYGDYPDSFPHDPFFSHVSPAYRHTPSVYGPLFTAVSAALMLVVGTSVLAARIGFQLLTLLAVIASAGLLYRRRRDVGSVALLLLNPLVVVSIVNGGHNDAIVGLALLGAVLLAESGRLAWAGVAGAAAVLVKFVAALAVGALGLWVLRRWGVRAAAALGVAFVLSTGVGIVAGGGTEVFQPLREAQLRVSGSSPWNPLRVSLTHKGVRSGQSGHEAGQAARRAVGRIALLAVAALTIAMVARQSLGRDPALAVAATTVAYMLLGAYVLPWYLGWALPVLALAWRSRLTLASLFFAALLHIAYVPHYVGGNAFFERPDVAGSAGRAQEWLRVEVVPRAAVAVALVLGLSAIFRLVQARRDDMRHIS